MDKTAETQVVRYWTFSWAADIMKDSFAVKRMTGITMVLKSIKKTEKLLPEQVSEQIINLISVPFLLGIHPFCFRFYHVIPLFVFNFFVLLFILFSYNFS